MRCTGVALDVHVKLAQGLWLMLDTFNSSHQYSLSPNFISNFFFASRRCCIFSTLNIIINIIINNYYWTEYQRRRTIDKIKSVFVCLNLWSSLSHCPSKITRIIGNNNKKNCLTHFRPNAACYRN